MPDQTTARTAIDPIDRFLHANEARLTGGISPSSLMMAYLDWAVHLANSPGKQRDLVRKAFRKSIRFGAYLHRQAAGVEEGPCIEPLPQDSRFRSLEWQKPPFNVWYQAFLLWQQWWHNATDGIEGVSRHHQDVAAFVARQALDVFSPSNIPWMNPEVLSATVQSGGANLMRGYRNFVEDWSRAMLQKRPAGAENFRVGREVAVTPGKVVFRNRLIELIQYAPATGAVHPEPMLIVPAWIMKYYILDLSPANSMIRYLVEKGHTVFMISWKNPTEADRDVGMEDYVTDGVVRALEAVRAVVPRRRVHAVGYCIGGTLLSIVAAALARDKKEWLETVTLFAAQTDFTDSGELTLFIDQSQVSYLEDLMWDRGYLDTKEMAGAFQLLRSNDLIWSRLVHDYLMGERRPMTDLMAWNSDATRMPYRMHSEYLRRLFLDNDLAEGHYTVGGRAVALTDIRVPIFVVGAEYDHVAPWKSVYKIHLLTDCDVAFLLTSGGHNAGIVSEPGRPNRHYRMSQRNDGAAYVAPEEWVTATDTHNGSWWPAWQRWLGRHSGDKIKPPPLGKPRGGYPLLGDAPGTYVLEE